MELARQRWTVSIRTLRTACVLLCTGVQLDAKLRLLFAGMGASSEGTCTQAQVAVKTCFSVWAQWSAGFAQHWQSSLRHCLQIYILT